METVKLYRPIGLKELALIQQSGWTAFPPRLEYEGRLLWLLWSGDGFQSIEGSFFEI
jgi:hypothetical protein